MHRTTIQLEGHLEREIRLLAQDQRRSLKAVMNDLLRRGLASMQSTGAVPTSLQWHVGRGKPTVGFDPADRATYFDLLDEGF